MIQHNTRSENRTQCYNSSKIGLNIVLIVVRTIGQVGRAWCIEFGSYEINSMYVRKCKKSNKQNRPEVDQNKEIEILRFFEA